MKLILSGGGIGKKCEKSYLKFAKELQGGKVLFIPFANDEQSPQEAFEWFKDEVSVFGINDIEMVTNVNSINREFLDRFKGIYFCGGNTFLLLDILKKSKKFGLLQKFFKNS